MEIGKHYKAELFVSLFSIGQFISTPLGDTLGGNTQLYPERATCLLELRVSYSLCQGGPAMRFFLRFWSSEMGSKEK